MLAVLILFLRIPTKFSWAPVQFVGSPGCSLPRISENSSGYETKRWFLIRNSCFLFCDLWLYLGFLNLVPSFISPKSVLSARLVETKLLLYLRSSSLLPKGPFTLLLPDQACLASIKDWPGDFALSFSSIHPPEWSNQRTSPSPLHSACPIGVWENCLFILVIGGGAESWDGGSPETENTFPALHFF